VPFTQEELQREQLMASMKASGLGGQMFSRDDIMNQMGGMQGMGEGMGLTGMGSDAQDGEAGGEGTAEGGLQETVAKAKEAVEEVVGQAKEAAAAVVDKAGSFLKESLGKLSSSFKQGQGDAEL
jgi:hypothetical protein